MSTDSSRYRFVPGVSEVGEVDLDVTTIHDQQGRRVTEATLDAEADDLALRYPNLRPGGKSLSAAGRHSPRLQVILPEAIYAEVHRRAEAERMSVSRWTRRLIERELART